MTSKDLAETGAVTAVEAAVPASAARPVGRGLRNPWVQRAIVWGALLLAWEVAARRAGAFFLPTVGSVLRGYAAIVADGGVWLLAGSLRQMLAGFALAALVGVPLGLAIGTFRSVEWALGIYVRALLVTSLTALLPFLILFFGTGFRFRMSVVFLFAIVYIVTSTAAGVHAVDRGLSEMASAYGASTLRRFAFVTVPGSLPFVISGLRLGLGQAVQGMIVAELWVTLDTGRRLVALGLARELGEFFALASLVALAGALLTHLLLVAQRRLTPWQPEVRASVGGHE